MYPQTQPRPAMAEGRCPIYAYRSNYPTKTDSKSRFTVRAREQSRDNDLYRSDYKGYRYINRAGGGTYRPRKFMNQDRANFMANAEEKEPLPKKDLPFERPQTDPLGRNFKENSYSKWEEHPLYETSNRMAVAQPQDKNKYHYRGRTGEFTQGFMGMTYRNVSLSTAKTPSTVLPVNFFGDP